MPFTIANYAYLDRFGRETVTWSRRFEFPRRTRAFDATMIHSKRRETRSSTTSAPTNISPSTSPARSTTTERCASAAASNASTKGALGFRFPLIVSGIANVREWWDEDAECFRIDVHVANKLLGPLFGYHGSFTVEERPCPAGAIPTDVLPVREERRE